LRRLVVAFLSVALLIAFATGVLVMLEWKPEPLIVTPIQNALKSLEEKTDKLRLLTFNIGYASLGAQADFFMDGGKSVRPLDGEIVQNNLAEMMKFLSGSDSDVLLVQEVDEPSRRSFGLDEVAAITSGFSNYAFVRALNYVSPWIPYPLFQPLGNVRSGLLTLCRYRPSSAVRHQLPGRFSWPVRVFHLKRCLHEIRLPAADGRDFVIAHLHLSVFDKDGHIRKKEMAYLKEQIVRWREEGHHVIVGGDWNQAFPGVQERAFPATAKTPDWFQSVPGDWAPEGFQWAFDPNTPSLRATNQPYQPGVTFRTIVDGFLVSSDLRVTRVQTIDLGFVNSDHNPVEMEVSLQSVSTWRPHGPVSSSHP
jgi:endonuclease/exonuclease/phosphatase family metal-dependent hydrolase